MKIRTDFVTNSSSSSYIICFARIADDDKTKELIKKEKLDVYTAEEVKKQMCWGCLGADWANAEIYGVEDILKIYPNDKFVIIEDGFEIMEDEDGDTDYYVDYDEFDTHVIDKIAENNGFDNIEVAYGAGRNG